jgi:tetratricopeptide (TPR) repeat protein
MGRLDEARDAYERAIERDPSDVKALVNLGLLYERRGEPERARQAYQAAVRVAPGLDRIRERVKRLGGGR